MQAAATVKKSHKQLFFGEKILDLETDFENWATFQCCGPSLEYCVQVFVHTGSVLWNTLSSMLKECMSKKTFKKKLKKYLLSEMVAR